MSTNYHEQQIKDHPEVKWALELLKPDPNHELGFLKNYISEISCMGLGFIAVCSGNVVMRRPFYAGIHQHVIALTLGYGISQFINAAVDKHKAVRDTKLRDYIIQNPELFPEPERVKFSQILEPWLPVR